MEKLVPRFIRSPSKSFFLFGPRGTGKSTWLRSKFPDALLLDLLDPVSFRSFGARPERLSEWVLANSDKEVVIIDEVQRLPELLPVVHAILEGPKPPRFVLTGSSARKLKRTGVDLLAGRALLRRMHPFIAAEMGQAFSLERALELGCIPLVTQSEEPEQTLRSYAALYMKEEVQAEGLTRNIGAFARFLEVASFSHGTVLNVSNIARESEVHRKVVESYLQILEELLLSFTLPVFARRAARATTVHPKFYFFDVGVFRSLRPRGPLDRSEEIDGAALEGLVAQHLRAWVDLKDDGTGLHYWRTRAGNEVDFVLYGPSLFQAIEVKNNSRIRRQDLRGLKAFGEDYPEAERILLYRGQEKVLQDGITCQPVEPFLRSITHPLP